MEILDQSWKRGKSDFCFHCVLLHRAYIFTRGSIGLLNCIKDDARV
jgi:hypothetical protein